jgi:hypothetical protein
MLTNLVSEKNKRKYNKYFIRSKTLMYNTARPTSCELRARLQI